jgi:hypothetical protein
MASKSSSSAGVLGGNQRPTLGDAQRSFKQARIAIRALQNGLPEGTDWSWVLSASISMRDHADTSTGD